MIQYKTGRFLSRGVPSLGRIKTGIGRYDRVSGHCGYQGGGYSGLVCEMIWQAVKAARGGFCSYVENRTRKKPEQAINEARRWLESDLGREWMSWLDLDQEEVLKTGS